MKKLPSGTRDLATFTDYKICLKTLLADHEELGRGRKTALARYIRCQPAYLSRVLNGDGELSLEQMEAATRFFVLNSSESHYLIALLGENRAGTEQLKAFWQEQLKAAKAESTELKGRLGLNDSLSESETLTYYGSWHYAAIHIATSIPGVQTISSISQYLALSEEVVRSALEFLLRVGLLEKKANRYVTSSRDIHLARKSPMVSRHHVNWKLKSIEAVDVPGANAIRYTGVVTLSQEDAEKLKELILSSIERARKIVQDSPEEILGCYSFEFFEIGKSKGLK